MSSELTGHGGGHGHEDEGFVQLPTPTIWPFVFAFGVSLGIAGMVTHWVVSVLGLCLVLPGIVGWFRQIFPHEAHAPVPVVVETEHITTTRFVRVHRPSPGHREVLPIQSHSWTVGLKGGLAGGAAMTVPAILFGLIKHGSIWYPVNLLAAGGFISWAQESDAFLSQFHMQGFLAALAIHLAGSILVGLLYGAMLPVFPKYPILTAGFVAPFLWTGLLYTSLGIISPILDERINWTWFVISQITFGLVAGFVVNLQLKVRTKEFQELPFAVRAGLHMDELPDEKTEGNEKDGPK